MTTVASLPPKKQMTTVGGFFCFFLALLRRNYLMLMNLGDLYLTLYQVQFSPNQSSY